jgi:uncharacterized protein (TIGR03435 family)
MMPHQLAHRLKLRMARIVVLSTPLLPAQAPSATPPTFEVASVKRNRSDDRRMGYEVLPGGRFTARGLPLYILIATAYNLPFQSPLLSGGPDWIRSTRYDIDAKAAEGAIPLGTPHRVREEKTRVMLQALLADRFKLVVRRETKEMPVYALVVGKNGPKLKKAAIEEKDCPEVPAANAVRSHAVNGGQGRGLHSQAADMWDLVQFVGNWTDRPLVDRTGIKGLYEIETEGWVPMRPRPPPPPGAEPRAEDIALADPTRPTLHMIFDRLGLKMESQKAPVESLVIQSVEKPSEN